MCTCFRKVDIRLPGKGNSNSHGARPVYQNLLDDYVDLDQQVVNKELSLLEEWGREDLPVRALGWRFDAPVRFLTSY